MKTLRLVALALALTGCTTTIPSAHYRAKSSIHGRGDIAEVLVRYLPYERHNMLTPNEVELHKAGALRFDKSISGLFRDGVLRELDASGYSVGTPEGAAFRIEISRFRLADKFTSLALYVESTWFLSRDERTFKKEIRTERRRGIYRTKRMAEDLNAMIAEAYEEFFGDPQAKALLIR